MSNHIEKIKSIIEFDINRAVRDYSKFLTDGVDAEDVLENIMQEYVRNFDKIMELCPEQIPDAQMVGYLQDYSLNMVKLWDELKRIHKEQYYEFNLDNPFKDELYKSDEEVAEMVFGN